MYFLWEYFFWNGKLISLTGRNPFHGDCYAEIFFRNKQIDVNLKEYYINEDHFIFKMVTDFNSRWSVNQCQNFLMKELQINSSFIDSNKFDFLS